MSKSRAKRPPGQIRQSQVVTTFGPGAMLDLPNHSVLVAGLDYWSPGGEEIHEPRLDREAQADPECAHAQIADTAARPGRPVSPADRNHWLAVS